MSILIYSVMSVFFFIVCINLPYSIFFTPARWISIKGTIVKKTVTPGSEGDAVSLLCEYQFNNATIRNAVRNNFMNFPSVGEDVELLLDTHNINNIYFFEIKGLMIAYPVIGGIFFIALIQRLLQSVS